MLGGWRLSSIFLWQSGPFMTPTFSAGDPSGTGSGYNRPQHPDRVSDGNLSNPTRDQWMDDGAFTCPGTPGWEPGTACTIGVTPSQDLAPIGRFGNSGLGVIKGPGTINLSMGLAKTFSITERIRLRLEGTFTNLPNHPNLADPQMAIDSNSFGKITQARASEFGGSRTGEVGVRIEF